jgi:hypothetical protein
MVIYHESSMISIELPNRQAPPRCTLSTSRIIPLFAALRQFPIPSFEEAKHIIDDYIHFYNYVCIQLKTRQIPYETRCLSS